MLDSSKGGYFSIRPDGDFSIRASYVGNSLIAKNEFSCADGKLELIDFMPLGVTAMMRIYRSDVPFFIDIRPVFKYGLINPGLEEKKGGLVFSNPESEEGIELLIEGRYSDAGDGRIKIEPGEGSMTLLYSRDLRYGLFSNIGFVYPDENTEAESNLGNGSHSTAPFSTSAAVIPLDKNTTSLPMLNKSALCNYNRGIF